MGGALAYANYDPVFKNQVDEYIPGFARLADTAADLFVERVKPVRPPSGVTGDRGSRPVDARVGYSKGNVESVGREKRKEHVIAPAPQLLDTVKDELSKPKQEQDKADLVQTEIQGEEKKVLFVCAYMYVLRVTI